MLYQIESELLDQLIEKYGEEEQLLQTMGECGELIAVIENYLRAEKYKHRKETIFNVIEEAVDVFFMIQQIRNIGPEIFDDLCSQKIVKVFKKLRNERVEE